MKHDQTLYEYATSIMQGLPPNLFEIRSFFTTLSADGTRRTTQQLPVPFPDDLQRVSQPLFRALVERENARFAAMASVNSIGIKLYAVSGEAVEAWFAPVIAGTIGSWMPAPPELPLLLLHVQKHLVA